MWSTQRHVCFSVHNHGEPIPEEERELMFQPLKRGAQYRRRERPREAAGLGLGLYICREIVLSHGGDLTVDSTRTDGTTFSVTLPRHDPA